MRHLISIKKWQWIVLNQNVQPYSFLAFFQSGKRTFALWTRIEVKPKLVLMVIQNSVKRLAEVYFF